MMCPAVTLLAIFGSSFVDVPRFEGQEIDPHAGEVVYAVTVADVNGDKKPDVVALTEDAVLWYQNPSWKKHVITQGKTTRDNVCIQPHDIDGDGQIDFAVGAGWRPVDTSGASTLQWLGRDASGEWQIHPIAFDEPSMHRIRFGDVLGNGKTQLVVAPLQGRGTKAPNWGDGPGAKVLVYSIPADPRSPDWPVEVASSTYHTIHNLELVDMSRFGGKPEGSARRILLAGREGLIEVKKQPDGHWLETVISPLPKGKDVFKGASEIKRGRSETGYYTASIEPFHGTQVVAQLFNAQDQSSTRVVLDDSLSWGHGLWCADLDGDNIDELIVGQRDPNKANTGTANPVGPGIRVYSSAPAKLPVPFTRHVVDDGGVAVEDLVAHDLDGDGKPEIIAGGRATHNVRIYWNKGEVTVRGIVALTLLHGAIAAAAISPIFFYLNVGTAQRVFGGSNGDAALLEDVRAYHDYASRTVKGQIPYRDFVVEYPIGAIPFFVIPRLVASSFNAFRWAFAAEMMVVNGLIVAMIAAYWEEKTSRRRALIWYSVALGALAGLPITRFDLAPTALAFWAALRWQKGKTGSAGIAAGMGTLVKLFPLVVMLPGMVDSQRSRRRGVLGFGSILVTGVAVWFLFGQSGVLRALNYHAGRGLEMGSLYAGVLIVIAKVAGWPLSHDFNHSSVELIAPGAHSLASASILVQILGIGLAILAYGRSTRRDFPRYAGASVIAFAAFGKVLSPQYMLWLVPFVVVLKGRAGQFARPLMVGCCVLSSLVYFWAGVGLLSFHPLAVAILLARNAGVVILLGVMLLTPESESA